jgi:IS1 family transposase
VSTIRSRMHISMLWWVMAHMGSTNASRPSGVRPVARWRARRYTPLYCLKTPSQRVGEVLTALSEGLDVSAAVRVFGHRHATITTWVARAGEHSAVLHNRWLRNLHLPHIQLDELRTRLRSRAHTLWLWVACDPISKLR